MYNTTKTYIQYNEDVLSGKIPSSQNIILACKRFKDRFSREDMYFDYDDVDRRIRFVQKMRQFKDRFNGKPLVLLPWQEWIFANIFGFKWKKDGRRVTTKVLMFVARKAGKTALAAALCLVQLFLDKNNGQEIDLIANTGKQAAQCFEYVTKFGQSIDPTNRILKPFRDTLKMPITSSSISVRNSESMTLDGLNSSTFICDEFHAAKNWKLYNVLKSSQGFQTNPLAIIITTAGYLLDGYPLFEMRKVCIDILKGDKVDDNQFSALYELDENDDWEDSELWIKANPAVNHTVPLHNLVDEYTTAKNMPWTLPEFKSKHLNIFCKDGNEWLSPEIVRGSMQKVDLKEILQRKEEVYGGIDLATTSDLAAFSLLITPNPSRKIWPEKYIFKTWCWVCEMGVEKSPNRELYKKWINDGYLTLVPGNVIDYDMVLNTILEQRDYVRYATIGYDNYNSSQLVINCEKSGLEMAPFSQKLGAFNAPTKDFERQILSDNVILDYNPLVVWAFNNVELVHQKGTDNVKPDKATDENKIDPVISIVESLGTYLYITGKLLGDTEIYSGKKDN